MLKKPSPYHPRLSSPYHPALLSNGFAGDVGGVSNIRCLPTVPLAPLRHPGVRNRFVSHC
jgi:hypothetical protein